MMLSKNTPLPHDVLSALEGQFAIERELHGGGMARLFLAADLTIKRQVVLKFFLGDIGHAITVDRFRREMQLAASLQHPNIVPVLSIGSAGGCPYYSMPYVPGGSLRARLEAGPIPVAEGLGILRDIARACAYAHRRGVIHRDLKPENILLADNAAQLADFGVARVFAAEGDAAEATAGQSSLATTTGVVIGTPAYMAPEQAAGDRQLDHRVDLYALALIAYEILTGRPAFEGPTPSERRIAQLTTPVHTIDDAAVPAPVAEILRQYLAPDPKKRPDSADALLAAFDLAGSRASRRARWPRAPRAQRRLLAFGIGMTAVILGAVAVWRVSRSPAPSLPNALAVLPFTSPAADTALRYLADGLADELISALQEQGGLRVASRISVNRAMARSPADAPRRLRVATFVEGSLQRDASALHLAVRLVDAADGTAIWSDRVDEPTGDLLVVERRLLSDITTALRVRLGLQVIAGRERREGTENARAFDSYLRGRWSFQQRGATSLNRAIDYFSEALGHDSSYAAAYAGLADAYSVLPLYARVNTDSALARAARNAERAVSLAPRSAAAFRSRGNVRRLRWDWAGAEEDLGHAVALDSTDVTAWQWLGEVQLLTGRVTLAEQTLATADRLAPEASIAKALHAVALALNGNREGARRAAADAVKLDPAFAVARALQGSVLGYIGDWRAASATLDSARRLTPGEPIIEGLAAAARVHVGGVGDPRRFIDSLNAKANIEPAVFSAIARIHLALGNADSAAKWLGIAADHRDPMFSSEPLVAPTFDLVRQRDDFAALVRRIGLDASRIAKVGHAGSGIPQR